MSCLLGRFLHCGAFVALDEIRAADEKLSFDALEGGTEQSRFARFFAGLLLPFLDRFRCFGFASVDSFFANLNEGIVALQLLSNHGFGLCGVELVVSQDSQVGGNTFADAAELLIVFFAFFEAFLNSFFGSELCQRWTAFVGLWLLSNDLQKER